MQVDQYHSCYTSYYNILSVKISVEKLWNLKKSAEEYLQGSV